MVQLAMLLLQLACTSHPSDPPIGDGGAVDGGTGDGGLQDDGADGGGRSGDGGVGTGDGGEPPAKPPAVVLFIGDGMGFEHVRGGGLYVGGVAGSLVMETLPIVGRLRTASLSGYTDSAASGTAMASGVKTWNNVLGLDRSYSFVANVLEEGRDRGLATGVVTTDRVGGATPAAFTVHLDQRFDDRGISEQLVASPPDVLLGGGAGALEGMFAGHDVQLVTTAAQLTLVAPDGRPVVGLFSPAELPFVRDGYAPDQPSLAQMTDAALRLLEDDPDGFVLMVEGARIDHASHTNSIERAVGEVAAFDDAIAVVLGRLAALEDHEVTVVVTADHECGGLQILGESVAGEVPGASWVWKDHTNADVPVFALGDVAGPLDGQRLDNLWVHAVLDAAVSGSEVVPPDVPRLADGTLEDLGAPVATQLWETSEGEGYDQLDALRFTADVDGLWFGLDGVFEDGNGGEAGHAVLLLVDLDWGTGRGLGRDGLALADEDGDLDQLLTALAIEPGLDGLGFDVAVADIDANYIRLGDLKELGGLRGFIEPWGDPTDLWWLGAIVNFDDGNLARSGPAPDAGGVGETEGGMEVFVPWMALYEAGLPLEGASIAVAAVLVDDSGTWISNQVLPPLAAGAPIGEGTLRVSSVAVLAVDGDGLPLAAATVVE